MPHNTTSAQLLLEVAELKVAVDHLSFENNLLRDALMRYSSGTLAIRQVDRTMKAVRAYAADADEPDRRPSGYSPDVP